MSPLEQDSLNIFLKSQIVYILEFATQTVSVATSQPCHCSKKEATENTYVMGMDKFQ